MVKKTQAYGIQRPLEDVFPVPVIALRAPTTSDMNYDLGQLWVYKTTGAIYGLANVASGSATWSLLGPGASDVDTLTGDAGGAISPAAGNITLAGGTNIATSGAGSTITFNLDAAITLATSVTSPIYTATAGLAINAAAGQDITVKMGDAAGANKVSFVDSASAEVFSIDSNGSIGTLAGLTVTGAFTTSGGTASVNASSNFNTVINSGTSTGTVTIGNGAAGAITVDTGAGISLDSATASNFTVTGAADLAVASTLGGVNITSGEAASSTGITINATAADGGVTIDGGTGGVLIGVSADCTPISVGDIAPTASRTVTIGGGTVITASVTDTIDIGPDGATTNADSIKTVNVNTGGVTTGQVLTNIASGAVTSGTHTTSIATGNRAAGTMALNIMTGTGTKTANLGNADAGTTLNIDAVTLINDSVNANTSINTGTSTGTVSVGNAAAGAVTVDTAAGISLDAATASNFTVTGAADLTLTSTAGSIPITAGEADAAAIALQAAAGGLDIDLGLALIADAAGNIELNSSAGTILIGNDAVNQNISLGTAGTRTVTVGSTTTTSALVLQSGTGDVTVTGTVKQIDAEFLQASGVYIPTINSNPLMTTAANTGGAATGATGDTNLMALQNGVIMEQFILGAGQTIIAPRLDANGLLISLDLVNTEGAEYNFGARNLSKCAFTVGTSAAFFFEVGLYINDMDGAAPYVIGFRKVEANNATFATYTDYATIGMIAASSTTNIVTATELNAGGQTVTDTTDAWGGDGATNTLKVLVSAAGVVTYTINGGAPSVAAGFTFDNGDVVMPFIRVEHSASATQVDITSLKCGFQA